MFIIDLSIGGSGTQPPPRTNVDRGVLELTRNLMTRLLDTARNSSSSDAELIYNALSYMHGASQARNITDNLSRAREIWAEQAINNAPQNTQEMLRRIRYELHRTESNPEMAERIEDQIGALMRNIQILPGYRR